MAPCGHGSDGAENDLPRSMVTAVTSRRDTPCGFAPVSAAQLRSITCHLRPFEHDRIPSLTNGPGVLGHQVRPARRVAAFFDDSQSVRHRSLLATIDG